MSTKKKFDPPNDFKSYLNNLVKFLKPKLFVEHWRVVWKFIDYLPAPEIKDPEGYSAEMIGRHEYDEIEITVSEKLLKSYDNKQWVVVAQDICHELAHLVVEELYDLGWEYAEDQDQAELLRKASESAVTWIEHIVMLNISDDEITPVALNRKN